MGRGGGFYQLVFAGQSIEKLEACSHEMASCCSPECFHKCVAHRWHSSSQVKPYSVVGVVGRSKY